MKFTTKARKTNLSKIEHVFDVFIFFANCYCRTRILSSMILAIKRQKKILLYFQGKDEGLKKHTLLIDVINCERPLRPFIVFCFFF